MGTVTFVCLLAGIMAGKVGSLEGSGVENAEQTRL